MEILVPHVGWLRFAEGDHVASFLAQGWFEYCEQAVLWLFLRSGDVVVDCGAHTGLFSVLASRVMGDRGTVLAIEPNPASVALLRENLDGNAVSCATVIEGAATAAAGTATLHAGVGGRSAYSSLHVEVQGAHDVAVRAITLDDLIEEHGIAGVDLLKIDVEGGELGAWAGCSRSIEAGRLNLVMVEFAELLLHATDCSTHDLVDAWETHGFRFFRFDSKAFQLVPARISEPVWYANFFAARDVDSINRRLAAASPRRVRIACEILDRGRLARALLDRADRAERDARETQRELSDARTELRETREERDGLAHRIHRIITSRPVQLAWALRLRRKPAWVDPFIDRYRPQPVPAPAGVCGVDMNRALEHLRRKGFRPRITLDVGAARGDWSMAAAAHFPESRFIMIDPLQESEPPLRSLCELDSRFEYVLTAVGHEPGQGAMNVTEDLDGSTLLAYFQQADRPRRSVPVTTLDGLLREQRIGAPDFVKIDVQGFELNVLRGGERALGSTEVLIVETNLFKFMPECPRAHDVIGWLAERGFVLFDLAGSLRRPHEHDLGQVDFVFVSKNSELVSSNRWH